MSQQPASKASSRIPVFTSRDEEAAWWDCHDLADYQDEFKAVETHFAEQLSKQDASEARHVASDRT